MKRFLSVILVSALLLADTTAFLPAETVNAAVTTVQVNIPYVESLPNSPVNYKMIDWNKRARDFDAMVFDFAATGTYLPIALWDDSRYTMNGTTFKLPAYVGPVNPIANGNQEAVAGLSSVLGGALAGINKSNQTGNGYANVNFADMCRAYYTSEGIISNNPKLSDGRKSKDTEFWYLLTPTLQFAALDSIYPSTEMDNILLNTSNKWYDAIVKMGGSNVNFNHWTYDFTNNVPVDGSWTEPDAAIGAGMLMYYAYKKFGTGKFLDAARWCMNFVQGLGSNPSYELLEYWGPILAAALNAEQGLNYDTTKMFNWAFNTDSGHRANWGGLKGTYGGYGMDGLMGSSSDHGGNYAFAMNSFAGVMAIAPVARYDQRYARAVGKYILNAASNSRLFYSDQLDSAHQDSISWNLDTNHAIPYEGLRYQKINDSTKAPFATGDPLTYSWPYNTDFGIYSGALSGALGGIVSTTNVSQILQLDMLKTDFFHSQAYATYLYYNPYSTSQTVNINVGTSACDLYDSVTNTFLLRNVSGTQSFSIPADSARVIVLSPANGSISTSGNKVLINNVFVSYDAPAGTQTGTNLALGKTAIASSTVNGNNASGVTAGDGGTTRWESATSDPQWIYVDLGGVTSINKVKLYWEAAYAKTYKLQISSDASTWTDVYSTSTGDGGWDEVSFTAANARYVRMYGTQRGTQYAYSMYEFEIYGSYDTSGGTNLALGKTAIASSTVNGNNASGVTAGDGGTTRWESATSDPQWIYVDLGGVTSINKVKLYWEAAYAKTYKLQISSDVSNWTDVYSTGTGDGGWDEISFTAANARYVRMYGTQRGTQYAYSMYEFEIYAQP